MGVLAGAAAPAAPAIAELGALVVLVVALGLILVLHLFVGALFRVTGGIVNVAVGWIPWLGKKAKGGLLAVEHRVNDALSSAALAVESAVADTWHVLAATIRWFGHEVAHTAQVAAGLWWYVNVKYPLHVIARLAHWAQGAVTVVRHRTVVIERRIVTTARSLADPHSGPIARGVKVGTRRLEAEIDRLDAWTRAKVGALATAIAVTIPGELGRIGAEAGSAARAARKALRWARRHERLLLGSAFTALMIRALSRVGAGWIRCGNVRKVGRRLCATDSSYLDDLLALTIVAGAAINIEVFAKALQEIADVEMRAIRAALRAADGKHLPT